MSIALIGFLVLLSIALFYVAPLWVAIGWAIVIALAILVMISDVVDG